MGISFVAIYYLVSKMVEKALKSELLMSGRSDINENLIAISSGRPVVVSQLIGFHIVTIEYLFTHLVRPGAECRL